MRYSCVGCGSDTEWDFALGSEPLCVSCWDLRAEVESEAGYSTIVYRRECYLRNIESNRACHRRYVREHRESCNEYHRQWASCHRELIASRQRDYYYSHHEAMLLRSHEVKLIPA